MISLRSSLIAPPSPAELELQLSQKRKRHESLYSEHTNSPPVDLESSTLILNDLRKLKLRGSKREILRGFLSPDPRTGGGGALRSMILSEFAGFPPAFALYGKVDVAGKNTQLGFTTQILVPHTFSCGPGKTCQ